jgi:U3 small nucleolar RNA-associated protein 15
MSDGTLSVRRRQPKASEGSTVDALRSGGFESFLGATVPGIGQGTVRGKVQLKPTGDLNELRVETKRRKRLKDYDKLLKNFKYSAALDSVLRKVGSINSHLTGY